MDRICFFSILLFSILLPLRIDGFVTFSYHLVFSPLYLLFAALYWLFISRSAFLRNNYFPEHHKLFPLGLYFAVDSFFPCHLLLEGTKEDPWVWSTIFFIDAQSKKMGALLFVKIMAFLMFFEVIFIFPGFCRLLSSLCVGFHLWPHFNLKRDKPFFPT